MILLSPYHCIRTSPWHHHLHVHFAHCRCCSYTKHVQNHATQDKDLNHTHKLFAQVGQESYPETDISAEQWLRNKGASDKVLAIADACYANDFGCNLHQLGLREMITENRKWDSGVQNVQC